MDPAVTDLRRDNEGESGMEVLVQAGRERVDVVLLSMSQISAERKQVRARARVRYALLSRSQKSFERKHVLNYG